MPSKKLVKKCTTLEKQSNSYIDNTVILSLTDVCVYHKFQKLFG